MWDLVQDSDGNFYKGALNCVDLSMNIEDIAAFIYLHSDPFHLG